MGKIAKGKASCEGVTWFSQLADKSKLINQYVLFASCSNPCVVKSTKVHLYWCMRNCDGTAANLQFKILNIINHYQV